MASEGRKVTGGNAGSGERLAGSGADLQTALADALNRVARVGEGVREDVAAANRARERDNRTHRRRNLVTMALAAVIVLLLGAALTLTVQNQRISRQNREISRQVADCTTAGGQCYRRGQERTGAAIAELTRVQVLVELCGQDPANDTAPELQRCVAQRMAEGG